MTAAAPAGLTGVRRALTEFLYFGIKQARACLFAGLFFAAVFAMPRGGLLGIPPSSVAATLAPGLGLRAPVLLPLMFAMRIIRLSVIAALAAGVGAQLLPR